MGDRNRKAKRKEHELDGPPSHVESNRSTAARVSGAYGGGGSAGASGALPIQDNPAHGQNAPRSAASAPVADQSLGRTTGLQPGVELGGNAPRQGLQLQGSAQDSGNRLPAPKVCPDCHNSVFSNNVICVFCACEAARKLTGGRRPPLPPPQRQQRPPQGLQGRSSPANMEFVADRSTGQQRGGAPGGSPAIENLRRGLMGPPQGNPEPRADESSSSTRRWGTHEKQPNPIQYVCPACHVNTCSSKRVVCQPCATARAAVPATGQKQFVDMADPTAVICPVEQRGGATSSQPQSHDQSPSRPQQHQQLDARAQQQEQLRRFAEVAADIWPVEQRGGAPGGSPAIENSRPGLLRPPLENAYRRERLIAGRRGGGDGGGSSAAGASGAWRIPRTGAGNRGEEDAPRPAPVVSLPHGQQQPGGSGFRDGQAPLRIRPPSSVAAAENAPTGHGEVFEPKPLEARKTNVVYIYPGVCGGASGEWSAVQGGHPGIPRLLQEHPVPLSDKPVGLPYDPVVLGPSLQSNVSTAARAYGGGGGADNPGHGQNEPGVEMGVSAPRQDLQLRVQAHVSGIRPPAPAVRNFLQRPPQATVPYGREDSLSAGKSSALQSGVTQGSQILCGVRGQTLVLGPSHAARAYGGGGSAGASGAQPIQGKKPAAGKPPLPHGGATAEQPGVAMGGSRPSQREFEVDTMAVTNKRAFTEIGGKLPDFVKQHQEALLAQASSRRAPRPRRRAPRARPPAATSTSGFEAPAEPDEPQPQQADDPSCHRCRIGQGTVALQHVCRCDRCTGDVCPFCALAAVPRVQHQRRGMCPSCGTSPGTERFDHVCVCERCNEKDCAMCQLVGVPRPRPRPDGACPCCLQWPGSDKRHLCLCFKCKMLPESVCPFCVLSEVPSALRPFEGIKLEALSMMNA